MHWLQDYAPVGHSIEWSALIAVIPVLYFFWALAVKRMPGHIAAISTLILAIFDAFAVYHFPFGKAISSTMYGVVTGIWPIGLIVVTAVFLYKVTVKTGQFDVIRKSITGYQKIDEFKLFLLHLYLVHF